MRPEQRPARPFRGAAGLACAALATAGLAACTTGSTGTGTTSPSRPAPSLTEITPITPTGGPSVPDTQPPASNATGGAPTGSTPPSSTGASSVAPTGGTSSSAAGKQVTLVVTYSGWNAGSQTAEVDAFAPGVLATRATCTLTMTKAGVTRTASRRASTGPSSTQCGALTIPGAQLSAGAWRAVVEFTSADAHASSRPVTITVRG